ncbi:voltage-dependent T-type calcium channel subunit alpha-1H [Tachysurus ichikawai]
MRILVTLLLDTLPMLGNVLLLCFFVFFIFGIVGVQLWAGLLRNRCFLDDDAKTFMNLHFYNNDVMWTRFNKTSSHPATFCFPLFSPVVFSCCAAQPMIVQMGELEMTWQDASQLIDCRTEAPRVLIFAILGRNQPYAHLLCFLL